MPDRDSIAGRAGSRVIDLGSNSLRLVVFERLGATLLPLAQRKGHVRPRPRHRRDRPAEPRRRRARLSPICSALSRWRGRSRSTTWRCWRPRRCATPRTGRRSPPRSSGNAACRCEIIDGGEEARLSAAGVLAGIPDADGVVGRSRRRQRRAGSGEPARAAADRDDAGQIGRGISLPLGPLRLAELGDSRKALAETDRAGARRPRLCWRRQPGGMLYLVGGAARAIARLHMEQPAIRCTSFITTRSRDARPRAFFDIIGRQSRKSLERITGISRKRLEVVPLAAFVLRRLIAAAAPQRSSFPPSGCARATPTV